MVSEPDQGMYDAVNKGLKKGTGTFCAYLNCDEQYLPGALARIKEEFESSPAAEIIYGGFLVADEKGRLVTARRPVKMFWQHVATSHLPNFTCATFFRRTMLEREQTWFDASLRACGDAVWTVNRLKAKTETRNLPIWTSLFTENRGSVGLGEVGRREARQLRSLQPAPTGFLRPFWVLGHRAKKLIAGDYFPRKISTLVFSRENVVVRQPLVGRASPFWSPRIRARA